MIKGIGVDIIEISRIEKSMKNPKFLEKVFTKNEIEYFEKRNFAPQSVAAGFCAKEAVSKAMGTGLKGFEFCDIEILHNENGAPYAVLYNDAKKILNDKNIHISLSHSDNYATAVAVIEE